MLKLFNRLSKNCFLYKPCLDNYDYNKQKKSVKSVKPFSNIQVFSYIHGEIHYTYINIYIHTYYIHKRINYTGTKTSSRPRQLMS